MGGGDEPVDDNADQGGPDTRTGKAAYGPAYGDFGYAIRGYPRWQARAWQVPRMDGKGTCRISEQIPLASR